MCIYIIFMHIHTYIIFFNSYLQNTRHPLGSPCGFPTMLFQPATSAQRQSFSTPPEALGVFTHPSTVQLGLARNTSSPTTGRFI